MPLEMIVDLYHGNDGIDLKLASENGLVGVIHKASEGTFADSAYVARRATSRNLGLLWGGYHFLRTGNPAGQADFFLGITQKDLATLHCLDLERDLSSHIPTLLEAEIFAQKIKDAIGRWPVVYTAKWVMDILNPSHGTTLLSKCDLWVASYTVTPVLPPEWPTWKLWQRTNGIDGLPPHSLPGIPHNDLNVFNGTYEEMKAWWSNGTPTPPDNGGNLTEKIMVTTANVNVRQQPTTSSTKLFTLLTGTKIVVDSNVVAEADTYHWVKWLAGQGYVAREYLKENPLA